jgi:hypothetical protein
MSFTSDDARRQVLKMLAEAIDHLGRALVLLSSAYEQLSEHQADVLERQLFRPVQRAYGVAQRTHAGFADRHRLQRSQFTSPAPEAPSTGVKGFIEHAAEAVGAADTGIARLQDSLMPIEFGDAELRAGLTDVRQLLDAVPDRAREVVRAFGR